MQTKAIPTSIKLIIAGTRTLNVLSMIEGLLVHFNLEPTQIVCGEASGPDRDGKEWAKSNGIPVKSFPADWTTYGKSAGPHRNGQMAEYADALLLIWDGESKGSANMKARMMGLKKPVYEVILKRP